MNARILVLASLALAACSLPIPFAEEWFFSTERTQLPQASDCQRCHGEIFEEWTASQHAHAWKSDAFEAFTAGYAARECLACHAPAPLGSDGEVRLRDDHRAEGVTCISCHLSAGNGAKPLTMRGPHARTTAVDAHPIVTDPLFGKAELCGTCHQEVLAEWKRAPDSDEKQTCQQCHMPDVRRTMESYDPARPYSALLVAMGDEVEGRRHRFEVPPEPWRDIEVTTRSSVRGVRVRVENRLPHGIPTGGFGRRVARVRVAWPGGEAEQQLRAGVDEAVPAGSSRDFSFPDAPAGAVATLERWNSRVGGFERLAPAQAAEPR